MANYTPTYESTDLAKVVIDNVVGIGAALFSFVTLIGLVVLWRVLKGKKII